MDNEDLLVIDKALPTAIRRWLLLLDGNLHEAIKVEGQNLSAAGNSAYQPIIVHAERILRLGIVTYVIRSLLMFALVDCNNFTSRGTGLPPGFERPAGGGPQ